MKKLSIISLFICLLLASKMSGQTTDSVQLKVVKVRNDADMTHYWFKNMETKENLYSVCPCKSKYKKGDLFMVARKDIEYIPGTVTWRKVNN